MWAALSEFVQPSEIKGLTIYQCQLAIWRHACKQQEEWAQACAAGGAKFDVEYPEKPQPYVLSETVEEGERDYVLLDNGTKLYDGLVDLEAFDHMKGLMAAN